ncbi:hypothetical protein DMENIID0001_116580 [Sergentomyia squamirostris]
MNIHDRIGEPAEEANEIGEPAEGVDGIWKPAKGDNEIVEPAIGDNEIVEPAEEDKETRDIFGEPKVRSQEKLKSGGELKLTIDWRIQLAQIFMKETESMIEKAGTTFERIVKDMLANIKQ